MGHGAGSFVGFDGPVTDAFATEIGKRLFEGLATEKTAVGDAICYASDPMVPGTRVRLAGSTGIDVQSNGIVNGDFELVGLQAWNVTGDGRQVTSFCGDKPLDGKFMAVISTGLGFTEASGALEQRFCIPADKKELIFSWRYYSAELEGTCGQSINQDRWRVSLAAAGKPAMVVRDCKVDDMCFYDTGNCQPKPCAPPSDCGCGSCYHPYETVENCKFEGQSVMATGVVEERFNVSALAGQGPVTLRISVDDKGQPTNDTAILLDGIRLQ